MDRNFEFPVNDIFSALDVTEPQFKIQANDELFEKLWVDFSKVRSNNYVNEIKRSLRLQNGEIFNSLNFSYQKIIFSGHRGSGKSVELKRLCDKIKGNKAYFTIFIDLEEETNIEQLNSEDIFVVLITLLIRKLEECNINFNKSDFNDIADLWLSETEVVKELEKSFNVEASSVAEAAWNFWSFFKIKGNLKSAFSRENKTTEVVRRTLTNNPKPLIDKFNRALISVKEKIRQQNKGQDIIFFIDGLEKANRKVYEELFINDVQMLTGLSVHIISTVPIDTYYKIIEQGNRTYFKDFYLPMIRINNESISVFKEMVYKRIDKSLIDDEALEYLIQMSGGCPRILLKLINRSFLKTDTGKLDMNIAETSVKIEGNERFRTLTKDHKDVIKSGDFNDADPIVLDLLQSLTVLEYNGTEPERKLNPVLSRFFE